MRASQLIPEFLRPLARWVQVSWRRPRALSELRRRRLGSGRPHGLPGELIVSLTSYPARFSTLHLTLRSLLAQSVMPDRVLLWVAHDDVAALPEEVSGLVRHGLTIRACDDIRSYKKLIPAIEAFPDAFIVTADDDLYYPSDWLEMLVTGAADDHSIRAWRTHRLKRDAQGIAPYMRWPLDVQDDRARQPSADLLPTSGGGALYPPRSLHPSVTDRGAFQRLCPNGDDLWFYWCARMAGTPVRKVGGRMKLITWAGSQDDSLWADNRLGGNDRMIRALIEEYGVEKLGLDQPPS